MAPTIKKIVNNTSKETQERILGENSKRIFTQQKSEILMYCNVCNKGGRPCL